jgi:hypothetical protein
MVFFSKTFMETNEDKFYADFIPSMHFNMRDYQPKLLLVKFWVMHLLLLCSYCVSQVMTVVKQQVLQQQWLIYVHREVN